MLNEERDHVAIQISLLADALIANPERLGALERKLAALELRISRYRPAEV